MSSGIVGLALANLLMLALGCGLLPLLRLARSRRELLWRLPLAYALGLAATGILAADLAVVDLPLGRLELALLAAAALALGLPGLPSGELHRPRRPRPPELAPLLVLAIAGAYVVEAARLALVEPLAEPQGWEVWATRARALYAFGGSAGPVFTTPTYPGLTQPLLLPGLEAVGFRFGGSFDGTLLHLQLLGFALALVGGAWTLLRRSTNPLLLAASLLAILLAPAFFDQLLSNAADIPLAVFLALGVASLGAWLRSGGAGFLPAAALFLSAATLTESDGEVFVLAAFLAAALASRSAARRPLTIAASAVVALDLPWRIWLHLERVGIAAHSFSNLLDLSALEHQSGRVGPATRELWHALWHVQSWSLVVVLVIVGLAGALLQRRRRLALFAACWLLASFAGLVLVSWTSTTAPASSLLGSSGMIDGLVLGGGLLVPLLLHTAPEPDPLPAAPPSLALAFAGRLERGLVWLPHRSPALDPPPGSVSSPGALPWRRPRRELLLLALVAAATLTTVYPVDAQDVSRLCLTRALVHLRLSDDRCFESPYARDRASYGGHLYSDKAPGMSVVEIPGAVAASVPSAESWPYEGLRVWAARILSGGLAFILCAFLVGRISEGLAPGYGGVSLVAFGLGTLVAPFAAANFDHVMAGTLGFAAFALAWRRRPLLAGLVAGAALDVEYQAGFVLAILAVYVAVQGRRPLVAYLCGLVPAAALLGLYDWLAFGAPWHLSYRYVSAEFAAEQEGGFFGIHTPYLHAIGDVFIGSGGLLRISPVVVAAAAGLVLLGRRFRAEALVCAAVIVAFVLLNCGYFEPYGGLSPGPRFLVPALPFLAIGLAPAFASRFRLTALLTLLSIVAMTALTLTWTNGHPLNGSIWGSLESLPVDRGSSWLVHNLTPNVLNWAVSSRSLTAALVALAAVSAFALALPLSFGDRREEHGGGASGRAGTAGTPGRFSTVKAGKGSETTAQMND